MRENPAFPGFFPALAEAGAALWTHRLSPRVTGRDGFKSNISRRSGAGSAGAHSSETTAAENLGLERSFFASEWKKRSLRHGAGHSGSLDPAVTFPGQMRGMSLGIFGFFGTALGEAGGARPSGDGAIGFR